VIHDEPVIRPLGDCYLSIEFGDEADLECSFRGLALKEQLLALDIDGVVEIYVTLPNVAVVLDRTRISYAELDRIVRGVLPQVQAATQLPSRRITMPVWYDDPWSAEVARRYDVANNFRFVAESNGMSPDELVAFHSAPQYWVVLVGFVPGVNLHYPMDSGARLTAPKWTSPRSFTPSRAVALAGIGTCQYTLPSPGGYQLLGRLAIDIYQPERRSEVFASNGVLLRPGDRIVYRPVDAFEYEDIWESVRRGDYDYDVVEETFDVVGYLRARS
jgi:KipI family sensor histidine kinase inhibitor